MANQQEKINTAKQKLQESLIYQNLVSQLALLQSHLNYLEHIAKDSTQSQAAQQFLLDNTIMPLLKQIQQTKAKFASPFLESVFYSNMGKARKELNDELSEHIEAAQTAIAEANLRIKNNQTEFDREETEPQFQFASLRPNNYFEAIHICSTEHLSMENYQNKNCQIYPQKLSNINEAVQKRKVYLHNKQNKLKQSGLFASLSQWWHRKEIKTLGDELGEKQTQKTFLAQEQQAYTEILVATDGFEAKLDNAVNNILSLKSNSYGQDYITVAKDYATLLSMHNDGSLPSLHRRLVTQKHELVRDHFQQMLESFESKKIAKKNANLGGFINQMLDEDSSSQIQRPSPNIAKITELNLAKLKLIKSHDADHFQVVLSNVAESIVKGLVTRVNSLITPPQSSGAIHYSDYKDLFDKLALLGTSKQKAQVIGSLHKLQQNLRNYDFSPTQLAEVTELLAAFNKSGLSQAQDVKSVNIIHREEREVVEQQESKVSSTGILSLYDAFSKFKTGLSSFFTKQSNAKSEAPTKVKKIIVEHTETIELEALRTNPFDILWENTQALILNGKYTKAQQDKAWHAVDHLLQDSLIKDQSIAKVSPSQVKAFFELDEIFATIQVQISKAGSLEFAASEINNLIAVHAFFNGFEAKEHRHLERIHTHYSSKYAEFKAQLEKLPLEHLLKYRTFLEPLLGNLAQLTGDYLQGQINTDLQTLQNSKAVDKQLLSRLATHMATLLQHTENTAVYPQYDSIGKTIADLMQAMGNLLVNAKENTEELSQYLQLFSQIIDNCSQQGQHTVAKELTATLKNTLTTYLNGAKTVESYEAMLAVVQAHLPHEVKTDYFNLLADFKLAQDYELASVNSKTTQAVYKALANIFDSEIAVPSFMQEILQAKLSRASQDIVEGLKSPGEQVDAESLKNQLGFFVDLGGKLSVHYKAIEQFFIAKINETQYLHETTRLLERWYVAGKHSLAPSISEHVLLKIQELTTTSLEKLAHNPDDNSVYDIHFKQLGEIIGGKFDAYVDENKIAKTKLQINKALTKVLAECGFERYGQIHQELGNNIIHLNNFAAHQDFAKLWHLVDSYTTSTYSGSIEGVHPIVPFIKTQGSDIIPLINSPAWQTVGKNPNFTKEYQTFLANLREELHHQLDKLAKGESYDATFLETLVKHDIQGSRKLIIDSIQKLFKQCDLIQYQKLLNVLGNYLPSSQDYQNVANAWQFIVEHHQVLNTNNSGSLGSFIQLEGSSLLAKLKPLTANALSLNTQFADSLKTVLENFDTEIAKQLDELNTSGHCDMDYLAQLLKIEMHRDLAGIRRCHSLAKLNILISGLGKTERDKNIIDVLAKVLPAEENCVPGLEMLNAKIDRYKREAMLGKKSKAYEENFSKKLRYLADKEANGKECPEFANEANVLAFIQTAVQEFVELVEYHKSHGQDLEAEWLSRDVAQSIENVAKTFNQTLKEACDVENPKAVDAKHAVHQLLFIAKIRDVYSNSANEHFRAMAQQGIAEFHRTVVEEPNFLNNFLANSSAEVWQELYELMLDQQKLQAFMTSSQAQMTTQSMFSKQNYAEVFSHGQFNTLSLAQYQLGKIFQHVVVKEILALLNGSLDANGIEKLQGHLNVVFNDLNNEAEVRKSIASQNKKLGAGFVQYLEQHKENQIRAKDKLLAKLKLALPQSGVPTERTNSGSSYGSMLSHQLNADKSLVKLLSDALEQLREKAIKEKIALVKEHGTKSEQVRDLEQQIIKIEKSLPSEFRKTDPSLSYGQHYGVMVRARSKIIRDMIALLPDHETRLAKYEQLLQKELHASDENQVAAIHARADFENEIIKIIEANHSDLVRQREGAFLGGLKFGSSIKQYASLLKRHELFDQYIAELGILRNLEMQIFELAKPIAALEQGVQRKQQYIERIELAIEKGAKQQNVHAYLMELGDELLVQLDNKDFYELKLLDLAIKRTDENIELFNCNTVIDGCAKLSEDFLQELVSDFIKQLEDGYKDASHQGLTQAAIKALTKAFTEQGVTGALNQLSDNFIQQLKEDYAAKHISQDLATMAEELRANLSLAVSLRQRFAESFAKVMAQMIGKGELSEQEAANLKKLGNNQAQGIIELGRKSEQPVDADKLYDALSISQPVAIPTSYQTRVSYSQDLRPKDQEGNSSSRFTTNMESQGDEAKYAREQKFR